MNAPRMVACSSRDTAQPRRLLRRPPRRRASILRLERNSSSSLRTRKGLCKAQALGTRWTLCQRGIASVCSVRALIALLGRSNFTDIFGGLPPDFEACSTRSQLHPYATPTDRRLSAFLVFRARSVDFPFFDTSDAIGLPTGVSAPVRRHGHYRLLSVALGLQKARPPQDLT